MRLAYVTSYDARQVRHWSGLGFYIAKALEAAGADLDYIGSLHEVHRVRFRAMEILSRLVFRRRYLRERSPVLLQHYGQQVARGLSKLDVDVVFSPGTLPIACLDCRTPIAFWTDAAFAGMVDFYPGFSNLHRRTLRDGLAMEQAALDRCQLAVYSSDWAARWAQRSYRVDPAKLRVVPFGANLDRDPSQAEAEQIIANRPAQPCQLLFLGVDWERKGGETALAISRGLNRMGLKTVLTIVGCRPSRPIAPADSVRMLGFVAKTTASGRATLDRLLREAHFLVLPSVAECTPVVFSEANSFGVPCVTSEVGGIPSVIRNDVNGRMFPLGTKVEAYCDFIRGLMTHYDRYRGLARSSFAEYATRLNWASAGRSVMDFLHRLVH